MLTVFQNSYVRLQKSTAKNLKESNMYFVIFSISTKGKNILKYTKHAPAS